MKKINSQFFKKSAIEVAQKLLGKSLCAIVDGEVKRSEIIETEAYLGEDDSASYAKFGKEKSGKWMWEEGGTIGVYLCYGMHHMFNIVCESKDEPQAVLIRGTRLVSGPGRLSKQFGITKADHLTKIGSGRIWIEDGPNLEFEATERIGIDSAQEKDRKAKLRFIAKNSKKIEK